MKTKPIVLLILLLFSLDLQVNSQDLLWSQEAESGILSGGADINQACANASNGEFVRLYTDPANSLKFENISIDAAATYRLSIDYFYKGEQPLEILVNGNSAGIYIFPFSIWCYEGNASIMDIALDLPAGSNTLEFRPANGLNAPFLDKLEIYTLAPPSVELIASSTRVQPGQTVDIEAKSSELLTEDMWVELEVSGIDPAYYTLGSTTLVILAGQSSATTQIAFADQGIAHGSSLNVAIKSMHLGLSEGDQLQQLIRIVTHAEVIYVSSTTGNDQNSGVDPESALRTLEKLSKLALIPGDSVLFMAGDTFPGQLKVNGSGDGSSPVCFSRYGSGADPIIDGAAAPGGAFTSAVLIENQDHIILSKLEIANDRKVSRPGEMDEEAYGIQVLNSGDRVMQNFHFKDLTIREIFAVNTDGIDFNQIQTAGIQFRTLQNAVAGKEKNISDVLVEDCYITHTTKAGIWSRHAGATAGLGNDSINRNMNLVLRNNHFFETGGSGIILSKSYNCLLENNIFEYTGSDVDARMAKRGSGAWFWSCRNVMAQYNKSMHVRGPADSYGMHIDFGNENVFLQYNYSEDSEGGFVEILGDNINSVYRFNISVNDGFRENKGNSLWVSDYAGSGTGGIKSDKNYIYNNTIYVDKNISPDIYITGKNTFVYNNIFYTSGAAIIGQVTEVNTAVGSSLNVSNNLFYGTVSYQFTVLDHSSVEGDPLLSSPGALSSEGYRLSDGSIAINAGLSFQEPVFPQAGKGIFSDIPPVPAEDHFGNIISIGSLAPNIGAYAGNVSSSSPFDKLASGDPRVYHDPLANTVNVSWESVSRGKMKVNIFDSTGRMIYQEMYSAGLGKNRIQIPGDQMGLGGLLIIVLNDGNSTHASKLIIP